MATNDIDRYVILTGKPLAETNMAINAYGSLTVNRRAVIFCADHKSVDRNTAIQGRYELERNAILKGTTQIKGLMAVRAEDNMYPIIETDELKLRTSVVYENPESIFTLQIPYGDWSTGLVSVPMRLIDRDLNLYHVSDRPIKQFVKVLKDGVQIKTGFKTFRAYTDSTGRQIAAVKFNTKQGGSLSAQILGVPFPDGILISNPGDIVLDVLEKVQGYSWAFINRTRMGVYRAECLAEGLELRILLNKAITVKKFLAVIAACTNATHTPDGGHGLVRRKGLI